MSVIDTKNWLKSISSINRELDFERESIKCSVKRIKELEKKKKEIYRIISLLESPVHKLILHKRYVQGKKWEDISEELQYELQHIHRLHNKAIEEAHAIRKQQK